MPGYDVRPRTPSTLGLNPEFKLGGVQLIVTGTPHVPRLPQVPYLGDAVGLDTDHRTSLASELGVHVGAKLEES